MGIVESETLLNCDFSASSHHSECSTSNTLQEGRPEQRNLNDASALAAKVAQKAEMKKKQDEDAAASAAWSDKPVVKKKLKKKAADSMDDLLSVGLSTGKGKKK